MHVETYEAAGLEVPVETWGSAGETLVFLTGLGCPPSEYRRGFEQLSRTHRLLVPDLSFRRRVSLPRDIETYLRVVRGVCDGLAPGAPWAGHSFGALLALLRSEGPAIACAPSVPAAVPFPVTVWRAARMQVREYLGLEGPGARAYAARILFHYVKTAVIRPRSLFPVTRALRTDPADWPVRSPRSVVFLCERDDLYRDAEYADYFAGDIPGQEIRRVPEGHDWPITHPDLLADRLAAALETVNDRAVAGAGPAGGPGQNRGN